MADLRQPQFAYRGMEISLQLGRLSLDGGGVRELSTLIILDYIMETLGNMHGARHRQCGPRRKETPQHMEIMTVQPFIGVLH